MFVTTPEGLKIYYEVKGEGEALFLLHGWGGNSQSMRPLLNHFCQQFRVFSFDLPGFGRSSSPAQPWGSYQYAQCIRQVWKQLGITRCHLLAHSFGGRVAIVLASQFPEMIEKLVLTASAGLPARRSLSYYLKVYLFKLSKRVLGLLGEKQGQEWRQRLAQHLGSQDYRSVSPQMRSVLVRVVNEDLKGLLPKIKSVTLLVWGENDQDTPLAMGRLMSKLIPHNELIILPAAGHFAYVEKLKPFCSAVSAFLKD